MTPRDPVSWRDAPPIPEEYRALMDRVEEAQRNLFMAQLGAVAQRVYITETPSVIPSHFQHAHTVKEPCS